MAWVESIFSFTFSIFLFLFFPRYLQKECPRPCKNAVIELRVMKRNDDDYDDEGEGEGKDEDENEGGNEDEDAILEMTSEHGDAILDMMTSEHGEKDEIRCNDGTR
ncbi:hypothetical protein L228DRAFT_239790 [Xylona heveae TC161]|uniref:Uncharacterized protein n=1 Tax=Xylona heveae (strain CBS 132557 / TC161) TaxID=1328760 RepID=A0A165G898_XYLHT|nr:hypothetical protein L228DRAFT_239790 [Xylona heveae TC161]KZF21857.1 hypothetical protein L228DRAFT_239790 [Xylona heveae TC161]